MNRNDLSNIVGLASSMINTSAYSFAAQAYGEQVEKVVSLFEGFVGIGCATGPLLGSIVYQFLGFQATFFLFGAFMVPSALLVMCFLPLPKQIRGDVYESVADPPMDIVEDNGM